MAKYSLYYNLNQIRRLHRKLLALEKTPPRPKIGNLREMMNGGIMVLLQQSTQDTNPEKKSPLVSENPPATPSGVNSLFPEKVIMDLRNGLTSEVVMGYEWNLVVRIPIGF